LTNFENMARPDEQGSCGNLTKCSDATDPDSTVCYLQENASSADNCPINEISFS
jgi:hypothetical protein